MPLSFFFVLPCSLHFMICACNVFCFVNPLTPGTRAFGLFTKNAFLGPLEIFRLEQATKLVLI